MNNMERIENLFLDDFRSPADVFAYTRDLDYSLKEWHVVRSYPEFVQAVMNNYYLHKALPRLISFDHDLVPGHYHQNMQKGKIDYDAPSFDDDANKTGAHCVTWLIGFCKGVGLGVPDSKCHSQSQIGKENILELLTFWNNEQRKAV